MIREINEFDKEDYIAMVTEFYNSDATCSIIPLENIINTFDELMVSMVHTQCFILEEYGRVKGYCLVSKTFSQEAGGMVIWIEELFVKKQYRDQGIATAFFYYVKENYPDAKRFRLEISPANKSMANFYRQLGFDYLDYFQMVLE